MYGANKALLNLIVGLKKYPDINCQVVLPTTGEMQDKLSEAGVKSIVAEVPLCVYPPLESYRDFIAYPLRLYRSLSANRRSINKISHIVKDYNPDIIHSNVGVIHSGYQVAKRMGVNHVWHIREFQDLFFGWTPIPSNRWFKKALKDKGNYNFVISDTLKKHYCLDENATVVYDGVFDEELVKPIEKEKANYFLYVGSLHESKGIFDIIKAFKLFSSVNKDYSLKIAGEGPAMNILKEEIEGHENIELLGYRSDAYELMRNAKALIVASTFEGFGFITVEAMLNGCLVIGRNTAATKEQLDNALRYSGKELGLRFDDVNDLVISMQDAVNMNNKEYLQICEAAQKYVINMYSIQKHAQTVYQKYHDILKS